MKTWLPAKFHAHFPGIFQDFQEVLQNFPAKFHYHSPGICHVFLGGFIEFSRYVYRASNREHNVEVRILFREKASHKETEDGYNKVNKNSF